MEKGREREENRVRLREGRQKIEEGSGRKREKSEKWRKNQEGKRIFECSLITQSVELSPVIIDHQ